MTKQLVLQECRNHERRDNFYPAQFVDWFVPNGNVLIREMIKEGLLKEDSMWSGAGQIAVRLTEKGKMECD